MEVTLHTMLVSVLIILLLAGQGHAITFESPGITVKAFCAELTRQTGRTYQARDEIQTDLLAIRVTNVPIVEMLKKLTFVERARVDFDGAIYTIRPDQAVRAKLKEDRFALRVKDIRSVQNFVGQFIRTGPLSDEEGKAIARKISALNALEEAKRGSIQSAVAYVQGEDQTLRVPTAQLLAKVFVAIPPEQLAALAPNRTAVWSSRPTALERPLPVDISEIMAGFRRDDPVWRDAAAKYLVSGAGPTGIWPQGRSDQTALLRLQVNSYRPGRVMTVLQGYAANGKLRFTVMQSPHDQSELDAFTPAEKPMTILPRTVSINPTMAKLIRAWSSYPRTKESALWSNDAAFLDAYYNPEKHDPVSATFGQVMLELARARGKQLIVNEADGFPFLLPKECVFNDKLNVGAIERRLADPVDPNNCTAEFSNDDHWITVRPQDLDISELDAFDRHNLGVLLRTARDKHALGVMDVALYAAEHDQMYGPRSARLIQPLSGLIPDLTGIEMLTDGNWSLYSFLGRLDEVQLAEAQRPEGLNLASCSSPQLSALGNSLLQYGLKYHGQTDVWQCNPTDGLPHGLPGGGTLHLSEQKSSALLSRIGEPGEGIETMFYTSRELARRLTKYPGAEIFPSYNILSLRPQEDTIYVFNFDFPDATTTTMRLNSYLPTSPAVKSIQELPEPLRGQVLAAVKKFGP